MDLNCYYLHFEDEGDVALARRSITALDKNASFDSLLPSAVSVRSVLSFDDIYSAVLGCALSDSLVIVDAKSVSFSGWHDART